jgi:CotH kinase protein/Lamin Tail Domain
MKDACFFALLFLPAFIVQGDVVINEISDKGTSEDVCEGNDWIELYNNGGADVALEAYGLHDDKGFGHAESFIFPADSMISSKQYLLLCTGMNDPMSPQFGISKDDTITLVRAVDPGNVDTANSTVTLASRSQLVEVVGSVVLPNTISRLGITYALDPTTGVFANTQTPTPAAENVISEPLTDAQFLANLRESLKEQNELGTNFFGMDDHGYPVTHEEFPVVLDLHVTMTEGDLAMMVGNASWESFMPFTNASMQDPDTGSVVWSRTTPGRIRTKGQSSLFMGVCLGTETIPFELDFSSSDMNQTLFGSESVYLRHHMSDYSYMRDHFYHRMLARFGLPHVRARKSRFFINGQLMGFYTLLEAPDQDYVFARSFPDFDPHKYALYKVKSFALGCGAYTEEEQVNATIRLKELEAQAEEVETGTELPPFLFERGEHNDPIEVFPLDSDKCFENFLNDLWTTWVDVAAAYQLNNEDCGETLVNEGIVDRDLGTNDYENNMKDFINQFYREDDKCDDACTNKARIDTVMDVQQALRTIAFYAVLVVSDSPIISGNNFYLAATGDGLGWKFVPYDFNVAGVVFCEDDVCNSRAVHWSIARPTCTSFEDSLIVGPLLSNPDNHQQYLEFARDFYDSVLTNSSLIDEIEAHAAAIEPYVKDDFWSLFGAFFRKELSPDAADWRDEDGRFPLLATMKARAEDLKEQFAAIDQGIFPRGPHIGVDGDNEAWEPCADWRAAEANRSKCEQGCLYDGCHTTGYTVESFCHEGTGKCLNGDYDEQCRGLYDEERYPGMEDTEDGRKTFCLFAKGVPVKAAYCPVPGTGTGIMSSENNGEGSSAKLSHGMMLLWSLQFGLTFIAMSFLL